MHNHIEDVNGKRKSTKGTRTEWLKAPGKDGLCFGERIEDLIKASGKNAAQISDETGIAPSTLSDFVNLRDRAPDAKTIRVLAQYFGVSTDYLFGLTAAHSPKMDIKAIEEYTGLSAKTVERLRDLPKNSLRASFLKRFFDDLIVEHEIDKYVVEDIINSAFATHLARREENFLDSYHRFSNESEVSLSEQQKRVLDRAESDTPVLLENGQYSIPSREAADIYLGNAIGTAQGSVGNVIQDLCSEILNFSSLLPVDKESLNKFRWKVYGEEWENIDSRE